MPTDLVFPKGNEEHLADMAKRLGVTHLIMCYGLKDPLLKERAKEVKMLEHERSGGSGASLEQGNKRFPRFTTEFAILVANQQEVAKARSITPAVVALARPEMFEDKRVAYIIDFETGRRDDFIHHRNSGLNQVFIANASKTGKTLLVNAHNLLSGGLPQPVVLGRMVQNNNFFRKYKPDVIVVSGAREPLEMRSAHDLRGLLSL